MAAFLRLLTTEGMSLGRDLTVAGVSSRRTCSAALLLLEFVHLLLDVKVCALKRSSNGHDEMSLLQIVKVQVE